ncbi:MAG TPA: endonuclease domain-containing protein [Anaerolineaceae bacterium]|nr:endonuclease domain-containing protein [Anaerolineaceae bacterium]
MPRRTNTQILARSNALRHNLTPAEARLWQAIRSHRVEGVHFRRQHAIGPYIVDFCAPEKKLVIEVDGGQHLEVQAYDQQRTADLESKGYVVLRFWNNEVMENLDGVLLRIIDRLGLGGE